MKKETRTVVYDGGLRIDAYRFEGIVQPFPNHFHEYYVIGLIESGERVLSCKNQKYAIAKGGVLLFNPGDNHACVQSDGGTLDYCEIKGSYALQLPGEYPRRQGQEAAGAGRAARGGGAADRLFRSEPFHELLRPVYWTAFRIYRDIFRNTEGMPHEG